MGMRGMLGVCAAMLLLASCRRMEEQAGIDARTAWVGNWTTAGSQTTTCARGKGGVTQLTGEVNIATGAASDTITTSANNCPLSWTVSQNVATMKPAQFCTVFVNGSPVVVTWQNGSSTMNGKTITFTNSGNTNNGCTFVEQGTLTKM
jgi:hypothetical protein